MNPALATLRTSHLWMRGYWNARMSQVRSPRVSRAWVVFADHFEPWWGRPDADTALARVRQWAERWPIIAAKHSDSTGRVPCYTFFYPEEQYHPHAIDELAVLRELGVGDVEVHLHHDKDTADQFVNRVGGFIAQLHERHGLLRRDDRGIRFGFIHGNWALDNSLPGGRFCGLNNEISLLRDLGCYADFTLPAAPSPAQTRIVNTIYWATDDASAPRSHDTGVPVKSGESTAGDLLMIPGPLTMNFREWSKRGVPKLECGELGGHCLPSRHRIRLWMKVAPRIGEDVFIKLFAHGAPEKNAMPMLADRGVLDRTLKYLREECARESIELHFVSAWQMRQAIESIRAGGRSPRATTFDDRSDRHTVSA